MAQGPARVIQVPWHIYRHYPADFSAGPAAARGFIGWEVETRPLDLDKTALLLMHLPDAGLTPDSQWGPDCPRPDFLGTVEWVPRTVDLIRNRLPRLVEAARAAGLQVVHVHTRKEYQTGPCWERSVAEAGDPPGDDTDRIDDEGLLAAHRKDVFQLASRPEGSPDHTWGMPEVLMPQGDDLVAGETWRLHRLMKRRGINHLIYCGWALNWCLWFSSGGMCDMSRHGYLCSAVPGGCVAIENRESAEPEANLGYALWKTAVMFGYVFDLDELTDALRKAAG
jgi:nicotinamidase-related amidase